jgi:HK97 family phage major capsid protein
MTIADLRKKRAAAYDSFKALATKETVLSEEESKNYDVLKKEVTDLDGQIDRAVEAQELAARAAVPVEPEGRAAVAVRPTLYSSLKSFKSFTSERGVIVRAEDQAFRAGQFILATIFGVEKAQKWCAENGIALVRAQAEGVNSAGGFLVPEEMMAAIIVLRETFGVFRREAQVVPMGRDSMNWPRRTGGVTAYFVNENTAPTESQASWDNVNLVAKKLAVLVRLSTELADDAVINVADYLVNEIAYAFASKEDDCGFNGDGSSTYGGITGLTQKFLTTATAGVYTASGHATFDALSASDIELMRALLPFYAVPGAKLYCSQYAFAACFERLIAAGGGNSIATLNGEIVYRYLGTPIVISQKMVSTSPTGKIGIIYGDLSKAAVIGERRQATIKRSDERYFDTDQIGLMGTERVDINVHDVGDAATVGPVVALKMG